MEADGGVEAGKPAEELGLGQVKDFSLPLVLEESAPQKQRQRNGNQFSHRKAEG